RSVEQQYDVARLLCLLVRLLVEESAGLKKSRRVAGGEFRIAQIIAGDFFGRAIGRKRQCAFRHIDAVVEREVLGRRHATSPNVRFKLVWLRLSHVKSEFSIRWCDWSDWIIAEDVDVQIELVDGLRIAERWFQRKREMRDEALHRQHLRVFHLNALRAIRRDGNNLCRKVRLALVFVVLLE